MDARISLLGVVSFYLVLAAVGVDWTLARGASLGSLLVPGRSAGWPVELAAGVMLGLVVVGLGRVAERYWEPARRLQRELAGLLPPLRTVDVAVLAGASSIGEEVLFRGAMQGALGFWPAVVLFGAAHGGLARRWRLWVVYAALVGAAFGGLTIWLGTLLAPVIAHFTINWFGLRALSARGPSPGAAT